MNSVCSLLFDNNFPLLSRLDSQAKMDIAKFLEAPIRSNPRRESQPSLLSTLLPPTPCETTSPASQSASPLSSFPEADAISRSEFDFTPADSVHPVSSAIRSQWPTELGTPEQQTAEEPHQNLESEQSDGATKPKRIVKAACSACRKRKAKVWFPPWHLLCFAFSLYTFGD